MKTFAVTACTTLALLAAGCGSGWKSPQLTDSGLNPEKFIAERDGKKTALYTLRNGAGMEVCITNFGGRVVSLMVPDREGTLRDVVLGFDSIQAYFPENNQTDFCASIGRFANRIDHGRLVIDGDSIQLPVNNFGHCLHGGPEGWQYKVYDAAQPDDSTLMLSILSPDGDNGFPGEVNAKVTYTLGSDNTLSIDYEAVTDKPTVINMTNHAYFCLSGDPTAGIEQDILQINASNFTPVDSTFMTTGEIVSVKGTPFDFTWPKAVGRDIQTDNEQIANGRGFDHNFVLDAVSIDSVAAVLRSPASGIVLTLRTSEPGIQFYSGNFLDGTITGKSGKIYKSRAALCLETQHYPDSPNKPQWPSTVLRPGEKYSSRTIMHFSTDR